MTTINAINNLNHTLSETALSPNSLKEIVNRVFNENAGKDPLGLLSDRGVQNHFATSYQSRFFLELLQNARDSIVSNKVKEGKIKAWIEGGNFFFANNGAEFNEKGIKSICYPAISTKTDKSMIGHKGIGFNSILEITDHPMIITNAGTFLFSNELAAYKINNIEKPATSLPLFQLPLYNEDTIAENYPILNDQGFTTIFKFPLDKRISPQEVLAQASAINAQDVIFLSNISTLEIEGDIKQILIKAPLIRFSDNLGIRTFKQFESNFLFSEENIEKFLDDEASQFKSNSQAECKFLLELGQDGRFLPDKSAKLYLFYALNLETGFSFSIHSFFSVTIDRKSLSGGSPLNSNLFAVLAEYYCGEFLTLIKKDFTIDVLKILAYQRVGNSGLNEFYNLLKKNLVNKEFIYHPAVNVFLSPNNVLLVTKKEFELFRNGVLGDKYLLYVSDTSIEIWLSSECEVGRLTNAFILSHIEKKCIEFVHDDSFFQDLYNLSKTNTLDLSNKKVLLSANGSLLAGNEQEVYHQLNERFFTPVVLEKTLAFLKKEIKVDDFSESQRRLLGLTDYSVEALLSAALRLYKKYLDVESSEYEETVLEIIRFLKKLNPENKVRIKDDISFPVIHKLTGSKSWKNLLQTAVYYYDYDFAETYEDDFYFINIDLLRGNENFTEWKLFMDELGVWKTPAAIINPNRSFLPDGINYIDNDRLFHIPKGKISLEFSNAIIKNWFIYREFIISTEPANKIFKLKSNTDENARISNCSLIKYLKNSPWIPTIGIDKDYSKKPNDVIAIDSVDNIKTQNQILHKYLNVIVLNAVTDRLFIKDLEICHLQLHSLENFKSILKLIQQNYPILDQVKDRNGFEKMFNRILTYLYDYLSILQNDDIQIRSLKEDFFLSKSFIDMSLKWSKGKDTIHVNNQSFFDKMAALDITRYVDNPFTFTKKDRNEWGKFAQKIGRPVSGIIKTEITSEGEPTGLTLFQDIEVVIAFVEDDQKGNFSDHELEAFRDHHIILHNELIIKATVDEKETNLPQEFYVQGEKQKTILHINRKILGLDSKALGSALAAFFEQYTGDEMRRLDLTIRDILTYQKQRDKYRYASKRNIDLQRIEEIATILSNGLLMKKDLNITPKAIGTVLPREVASEVIKTEVTEVTEILEVVLKNGHHEFLKTLDEITDTKVTCFIGTPQHTSFFHKNFSGYEVNSNNSSGATIPSRYSANSLKDIGFYGEYYVYKKIISGDEKLLKQLGLDLSGIDILEWFNIHRVTDKNLRDESMGMGCDMCFPSSGISIEVKAMKSQSEIFNITAKEFARMKIQKEKYFLIIVKHVYDPALIEMLVIQNPYQQFLLGNISFIEAKISSPF